jgi:hypothetical protein
MALLHHPDKNPNDPTASDRVSIVHVMLMAADIRLACVTDVQPATENLKTGEAKDCLPARFGFAFELAELMIGCTIFAAINQEEICDNVKY